MKAFLLKTSILLLSLFLGVLPVKGQQPFPELINDSEFRPVAQAAVDSVYNFNFEAAGDLLSPWKKQYPEHPLWMLINAMELWWHVLSDLEDTSHDEDFFYRMKKTDYEAARLLRKNSKHADGLIIKAISNGYAARQYANRNEWLNSINSARKALSAHEYLLELQPGLNDLKIAEGLKLYYLAYLPKAYPVVKTVSWALPDGDKDKGLKFLEEAAENAVFARAEAIYFLGNINYNYQEDYDEAAKYFEQLYHRYPHNNYYARQLVASLYQMGRYEQAMKIIDIVLKRWNNNELPYKKVLEEELLTWKGRIMGQRNNAKQAIHSYKQAFEAGKDLPDASNRKFHIMAGYNLGRLLYRESDYKEARKYLQGVKDSKSGDYYREQAERLLQSMPNE